MSSDTVCKPKNGEFLVEVEEQSFVCNIETFCDKSEYFKAMLGGSFAESENRIVKLGDLSVHIFSYFHYWMTKTYYFDDLRGFTLDFLLQLLRFCDRFLVNELRNLCHHQIEQRLNNHFTSNPGIVLNVAILINDVTLQEIMTKWIEKYIIEVPEKWNIMTMSARLSRLRKVKQNNLHQRFMKEVQPEGAVFLSDMITKYERLFKEHLSQLESQAEHIREELKKVEQSYPVLNDDADLVEFIAKLESLRDILQNICGGEKPEMFP